ncbi:MAG: hypothetical protein A2Y64_05195 [Candidatus Coatesbacteria bacterium RBG_13_66_14]|uniref:Uncharacterized protein n=1 Tax=Candidatus Coatesbacteria bacterium RBG_13_66_14 TaxID=1817816 RepID=A0A1F5FGX2_9BACT|nr:MAG: hypothetical protein A2Y64_05195 [Candidatus Coatesbacteria bacterium RBG_13_66_14]
MANNVRETAEVPVGPVTPGVLRALELLLLAFAGYFILAYLRPDQMADPVWAWIYGAWAVLTLPLTLRWVLVGAAGGRYASWGKLGVWLFRDPRPDHGARGWLLAVALVGLVAYPLVGGVLRLLTAAFSPRVVVALAVMVGLVLVDRLVIEPLARRRRGSG